MISLACKALWATKGGLKRWIMGSVTEHVLVGSNLPIFVVRPEEVTAAPTTQAAETTD